MLWLKFVLYGVLSEKTFLLTINNEKALSEKWESTDYGVLLHFLAGHFDKILF